MQILSPSAISQVQALLQLEANAITRAAHQLQPEAVEKAVDLLLNCSGKIVLSGVGKSGIVAQKIAATLNSIGTMAVSLHPCDALHGDLGIVTAADVGIVLSNSGETEELIAMMPHLKNRQVPIIAVLGNVSSTLARYADVVLDAAVDREACPLNLAPTTSTTVALAIGDALAMTVMQIRGITSDDFALNHPAGRLGKRLTLTVEDLMHCGNPVLLPDASWLEVVGAITQGGSGAVSVVSDRRKLLGLITDGDLRRWVQKTPATELETLTAAAIMTENPVTITPRTLAYTALKLMEDRPSQIAVLPVVDDDQCCVGLLRLHDIFRSGL
ncbi:KpsF/GutQ family protein [Leptolyngbya boryana NIES-2135]|jgi:arabinose-5-phosphate isomerase|uniref:KpsF/GutQ family protein n=1 Tax=Leptolyngbya boryana NIES-2135 TaxID=1973484 RepID=A0A1Z4JBP3_LEPBY|nr:MULTISPECIES: KpsF/GutQ family sugar-phosphate isomerase [Leptolyngbya]BAY54098.1 KpsF/GutQ family protein [Leptolyngbya boryana NIES-2135]MBD2369754.1 KpsF/GutQ family sugar-phosphate isomerase [Leptolyngbya sp. FACHB-161]MBD2376045.1 KpsF/GutQ family sugar-phosphate isomerase [Leptolyngbya sp. FACHB-238]MBD2400321.1 KpsF/GutQ family sugar-phosphate isomerase [Leptolyngbya sp. FACHB-239]MBD2406862.1 KpsF/GutQ family sugar-phosphate isomerase [Leptolyngbya sp. FACHB-402]